MAVAARYALTNSPRAKGALREFKRKVGSLEPVGPEIHSALIRQTQKVFDTDGGEIGESWPGYTGSERLYGAIKSQLIGYPTNERKLRWSPGRERLFPSLMSSSHKQHVWRADGMNFEFGTSVPYAGKHQKGKGRGPFWAGFPKVKARPFLAISDKTAAEIRRILLRHIGV